MERTAPNANGKWHVLAVGLVGALCYLNTLPSGFVSDDTKLILEHPYVKSVQDWPRIFCSGHYAGTGGYRPLTTLSFALNYFFNGAHPLGFHAVNILLHALNSALVFLLLDRLLRSRMAAFIGALIFAVHPTHTEAVAWISGRAELLATAFFLIAWLFHFKGRDTDSALRRTRILGVVAFFCALLAKENALIFPVAIVFSDLLEKRLIGPNPSSQRGRIREWTRSYLPYLATIGVYFIFRTLLYHQSLLRSASKINFVDNPLAHVGLLSRLLTAIKVQADYIALLIWPQRLCADYSFNSVPIITNPLDVGVLIALAVIAVLCLITGYSFVRGGSLWFGIVFYAVAILPTSNLLTVIGTTKAERFLYLPSLGFCFCAGAIIANSYSWLKDRSRAVPIVGTISVFAFVCLMAADAWWTWQRNEVWRNEDTLWKSVVAVSPNNLKAQLIYGQQALRDGRLPDAINSFSRAQQIDPTSEDAVINLGTALLQANSPDKAAMIYEDAIKRDPTRAAFHLNLGLAYMAVARPASGVREIQRAAELDPKNATAHFDLGLALSKTGDPDGAVRSYRKAIEIKPDFAEAWNALGAVFMKLGQRDEARAALQKALQIRPNYTDAVYNLILLDSSR